MSRKPLIALVFGIFLLAFSTSGDSTWLNESYNYRFPIISNTTNFYPVSINDTGGLNSTFNFCYIGNDSYAYYNKSLGWLIGNETQNNCENTTTRLKTPATPYDSDYVAVYHMDENTGTTLYDTVGGLNATITNSPDWSNGKLGSDLRFKSTNDYACVDDNALFTQNSWTLEAWFNATLVNSAHHDIVGKINSGSPTEFVMRIDNANKLDCEVWLIGAGNVNAVSTTVLQANTWYHGACVFNDSYMKVYVNGVLEATSSTHNENHAYDGTAKFCIGWESSLNFFHYQGHIDEVRYSKVARSGDYLLNSWRNGNNTLTKLGAVEEKEGGGSSGGWWDGNYTKCRNLTINNTYSALTNFQVYANITYDSNMKSDFSDLRVVDQPCNNTGNAVPYLIENNVSSSYADLWFKATTLGANSNTTYSLYYGNSTATNQGNGTNVFIYFEDFESGNGSWTNTSATCLQNSTYYYYGVNSMKVNRTSNTGKCNKTITTTTSNFTIDLFLMSAQSNRYFQMTDHVVNGSHLFNFGWNNAGHYTKADGWTDYIPTQTYTAMTWDRIRIYVDITDKNWTFRKNNDGMVNFVNSTPLTSTYPSSISSLFILDGNNNPYNLFVDNIKVREMALTEPNVALGNEVSGTSDTSPPTYSLNSTNSTSAGTPVKHSLNWDDDNGLSGYIFSFDNCTGILTNNTWTLFSGSWSNVTKTINSTVGCTIRWCVYSNDTSNNWNGTSCITPFTYISTSASPPSPLLIVNITQPNNNSAFNISTNFTFSGNIICNNSCGVVNAYAMFDQSQDTPVNTSFWNESTGSDWSDGSFWMVQNNTNNLTLWEDFTASNWREYSENPITQYNASDGNGFASLDLGGGGGWWNPCKGIYEFLIEGTNQSSGPCGGVCNGGHAFGYYYSNDTSGRPINLKNLGNNPVFAPTLSNPEIDAVRWPTVMLETPGSNTLDCSNYYYSIWYGCSNTSGNLIDVCYARTSNITNKSAYVRYGIVLPSVFWGLSNYWDNVMWGPYGVWKENSSTYWITYDSVICGSGHCHQATGLASFTNATNSATYTRYHPYGDGNVSNPIARREGCNNWNVESCEMNGNTMFVTPFGRFFYTLGYDGSGDNLDEAIGIWWEPITGNPSPDNLNYQRWGGLYGSLIVNTSSPPIYRNLGWAVLGGFTRDNRIFLIPTGMSILANLNNRTTVVFEGKFTGGNYTSNGKDTGSISAIVNNVSYSSTEPTNTNLRIQIGVSNDSSEWTWTSNISSSPSSVNLVGRYVKYRIYYTGNITNFPTLNSINIAYSNTSNSTSSGGLITQTTPISTWDENPYSCGNMTNTTCTPSWNLNGTVAGNYTIFIYANSTLLSNSSQNHIINITGNVSKLPRTCTLATDKGWTRNYDGTYSSTTCSVSEGSSDGSMTFTVNGGGVSTPNLQVSVGTYNYVCQWTGGSIYLDCEQQSNTLTINSGGGGTSPLVMSISGSNVSYPNNVNIIPSESNSGDSDVNYTFWRNSTLLYSHLGSISYSDTSSLSAGWYVYKLNSSGGTNYTPNATGISLNINVSEFIPQEPLANATLNITVYNEVTLLRITKYKAEIPEYGKTLTIYKAPVTFEFLDDSDSTYKSIGGGEAYNLTYSFGLNYANFSVYMDGTAGGNLYVNIWNELTGIGEELLYKSAGSSGTYYFQVNNTDGRYGLYPVFQISNTAGSSTKLYEMRLLTPYSYNLYGELFLDSSFFSSNNITNGTKEIVLSTPTEYERSYYVALSDNSKLTLNGYLLTTGTGSYVTYFVYSDSEPTGSVNATVTAQRFLFSSWRTIAQSESDSQGKGYFVLYPYVTYKITAQKGSVVTTISNYYPNPSFVLYIYLNETASGSSTSWTFDDITLSLSPSSNRISGMTTFTFTISASNGNLEYYYMGVYNYNKGNTTELYYDYVDDSPSGGTIEVNVNVTSQKLVGMEQIRVLIGFKKAEFEEWNFTKNYISGEGWGSFNYTFPISSFLGNFSSGALGITSTFGKGFIAIIIALAGGIMVGRWNGLGGALVFIAILSLFAVFGMFSWYIIVFLGLLAGGFYLWRAYL